MQLYLIRHAIAVPSDSTVIAADGGRALTEVGVAKMRKQASALERLGVKFDVVLTSPLVRARQTAEIVCDALNCAKWLEICDALAPGCEIDALAEILRQHESAATVALIGHNPDLEQLATALVGGSGESIVFRKGAVCRIDVDRLSPRPAGRLVWHLTPQMLRRLAK